MVMAKTTTGINGRTVYSLADFLDKHPVSG
jgi:hypothetical protein